MYKIGDIVYCNREMYSVKETTTVGTHVVIFIDCYGTVFINLAWVGDGGPRLVYNEEWIRHVR